ncbi:MAG TPA: hypothetical protein PLP22_06485 [Candidatus Competibacter sp.]|nr:hypothetical protein [Candidatus Competibacteraceae bacterium]HRE54421.1 hypothetical protein [Candidatus Competibacter sp.]HUM94265.1 hypothetical protein [Candidatus Competibacter sp.]
MKTLVIASVLGVASSLFNAAHAGFNDRGEDFIAYVKSDPNVRRPSVAVVASGFNDRGHDDAIRTHASTAKPLTDVRITHAGFNNSSHISGY